MPALLFSKITFFLTPKKLRELWVIFLVVTATSGLVASALVWLFKFKCSQRKFCYGRGHVHELRLASNRIDAKHRRRGSGFTVGL
ncbi:hypothetical protein Ac2012v2_006435 [Leucoagaricus gongylophorus]